MNSLRLNDHGQFVIEAVLLMTLLLGLLLLGVRQVRDGQFLAKMVQEPWGKTSGMIESGVWAPPDQARVRHPNQLKRAYTPDPEESQ